MPGGEYLMLGTQWSPWSMFLMLDLFSKGYFVGFLCTAVWGYSIFVRFMRDVCSTARKDQDLSLDAYSKPARQLGNLHSVGSFAMVLTSACCANQIFGVWFTYMARVTDANPFFALREAWIVTQMLVCLIVSLDALRRYALAVLERKRSLIPE